MSPTRFTELVGCELPVQSAPMGGVATSTGLALAVTEAGGHGMLAAVILPVESLEPLLDEMDRHAAGPWGVSFLLNDPLEPARLELAAAKAPLIDFFWAQPDLNLVERAKAEGALCSWQVGSAEEARAAEAAGCDLVVAQGVEAGGHVRGTTPLLELIESLGGELGVPVVAAGGISTSAAAAAAASAGADAVRVGTRLIASEEADAHPAYVEAILAAQPEDTTLTEAFQVMWPDAPHRVLRSAVAAAEGFEGDIVAQMKVADLEFPVPRFSAPCPNRSTSGEVNAMALYAGLGVGGVREVAPAAKIVRELADGFEAGAG